MQNFQVAFTQNRRIALRATSKDELKKEKCVINLLSSRRDYRAKRRTYGSLNFYILRYGGYREKFRAKEDWGWHTWESKTLYFAYEVTFAGILPTEESLESLFRLLANPSGERQGHIHWIDYEGHFLSGPSTAILVGSEHINSD